MKKFGCIILGCILLNSAIAQNEKESVSKACLNYIEGFYEGDTTKLVECLRPSLYKSGYFKNNNSGQYEPDGQMTYRQALDYARRVLLRKNFAKPGAPKSVEVLNIGNSIAAAKVTAWWGIDYILLSKQNNKWMIEQVLWEGPLPS